MEFIDTESAVATEETTAPALPASAQRWPRLRRIWRGIRVAGRWIAPWIGPGLVTGVYLWLAITHFAAHRWQINPDGVGYLSVAQKLLRGDFFDSINAYWSPLYSWLLVPLLAAGIEPLAATKVLGIGIGGLALAGAWRILRHATVPVDVRVLACLAAAPLAVDAAYAVITPDLLVAAVLLWYLATLCNPAGAGRWTGGARVGLAAGLAFLAKAYALPFVIGHFILVRLVQSIRPPQLEGRRGLLIATGCTMAVLALIVGAWSSALRCKFGYFTAGSTGSYNLRLDAPDSPGQVMHWAGFLPPPDAHGISAWDDITPHLHRIPEWNPLATEADRSYLRNRIEKNYQATLKALEKHTAWFYPLVLLLLLIPLARADLRPTRPGLILAAAFLIYPCGYLILHVERRFLLIMPMLLLIGAAYAIGRASARGLLSGWWRRGIAMAVIGWTFVALPMSGLEKPDTGGEKIARWADALRDVIPAGAQVASDGNWSPSLYLSSHLDWRYYGEPRPRQPEAEIRKDLDDLGVEYFLAWNRRTRWPAQDGWTQIPAPAEIPVRIFRRPQP